MRAGPTQTRLLFKYMPIPFSLPEDGGSGGNAHTSEMPPPLRRMGRVHEIHS
jgi:hypothetical protein